MKITKTQLKKIIREELGAELEEVPPYMRNFQKQLKAVMNIDVPQDLQPAVLHNLSVMYEDLRDGTARYAPEVVDDYLNYGGSNTRVMRPGERLEKIFLDDKTRAGLTTWFAVHVNTRTR